MGWETPKTDWKSASIPTPTDFNRMEGNAKELKSYDEYLETILGRKNSVKALPVANGGTGATEANAARKNLGLCEFTKNMSCSLSTGSGTATERTYEAVADKETMKFQGLQIGNTIICSGCIDFKVSEDKWVKISTEYKVISVVASVKKASSNNYAPECVCFCEGDSAYIASDESSSEGFYVTLTLLKE